MIPILFVFPPSRGDYRFRFHLGAGYIQAYLEEKGIRSSQYMPHGSVTLSNMVDDILTYKPEIVGFTCYDSNYYIIKLIARILKKREPTITLVAGGPTATFCDSFILKDCPDIDICVRGEGEETTYELIRQSSTNLGKVEGITYRDGFSIIRVRDRQLIRGETRDAELDVLPSPYLQGIAPLDGQAGILTSRGCIFKCTFCNFSAMSRHSVRYHSVKRVIEELHRINEYVNDNFSSQRKPLVQFNDDTFSLNTERAKEICQRIIDEKIKLRFYADTRADFCDAELLELMYKAGFREINFGLESAVPRILRIVKKIHSGKHNDFTPEKRFLQMLRENVKLARELGFHISVSVILGLPGETKEDALETLQFVKQLDVDEYSHNFLKIYSGTELFETYKNYNLDIKKSETVLPYHTIYTYNPYILKPLHHASLHKSTIENETTFVELLANNFTQFEGKNWLNLIGYNISKQDVTASLPDNLLTVPFSFYHYSVNHWLTHKHVARYIGERVRHGYPVGNFFFMNKFPLRKQVNKTFKLMRFSEFIRPRSLFVEIPFSKYRNRNFLPKTAKVIMTITNKYDLVVLIHTAEKSIGSECMNLEQPYPTICIRDECQWAKEPCPAMNFHRLIIRADLSVVTCFNGEPIGCPSSTYEEMEKSLKYRRERELLQRNCASCSVKDICSKCLFPFPLTVEEYCNLRRAHPEIGNFVSMLRGLRILLKDGSPLRKKKVEKISMVPKHRKTEKTSNIRVKKEIELTYVDGSPYAVDLKASKIFGLNQATANILKCIIRGSDLKDSVGYLSKDHGKEKSVVVRFAKEALKVFEKKGFLELNDEETSTSCKTLSIRHKW